MDCGVDDAAEADTDRSPFPTETRSPAMDRNPSPPRENADGEEEEGEVVDAIGDTFYSKHWLFSTLTRLINMVSEHLEVDSDGQTQLSEDDEDNLCKVWDMAMDKDVAGFLQEFKATDILLGVLVKSRCPRLTEICVGILGNIACFPETCQTLSQNEDLGAVLLLLLGDTDPPTLLETSRLLLTCVSQKDVCSVWLRRIRRQTSVLSNLCFIMCSSTNTDLLEKVGELVEKLFDLDEELMKSWLLDKPSDSEEEEEEKEEEEEEDGKSHQDVTLCLLEAAKQLKSESPNGLEVYLHALQLLTTIDEGIQTFAAPDGPGRAVWDFACDIVCENLCQSDDLSVVLHDQKSILVQAFAVVQALYRYQDQWSNKSEANLPLIGTILRVLEFDIDRKSDENRKEETQDEQLQTLTEITAELLADVCSGLSKETVADLVKKGYLTEKTCLTAAGSLAHNYKTSFQHLHSLLSETDPRLADMVRDQFPV